MGCLVEGGCDSCVFRFVVGDGVSARVVSACVVGAVVSFFLHSGKQSCASMLQSWKNWLCSRFRSSVGRFSEQRCCSVCVMMLVVCCLLSSRVIVLCSIVLSKNVKKSCWYCAMNSSVIFASLALLNIIGSVGVCFLGMFLCVCIYCWDSMMLH